MCTLLGYFDEGFLFGRTVELQTNPSCGQCGAFKHAYKYNQKHKLVTCYSCWAWLTNDYMLKGDAEMYAHMVAWDRHGNKRKWRKNARRLYEMALIMLRDERPPWFDTYISGPEMLWHAQK